MRLVLPVVVCAEWRCHCVLPTLGYRWDPLLCSRRIGKWRDTIIWRQRSRYGRNNQQNRTCRAESCQLLDRKPAHKFCSDVRKRKIFGLFSWHGVPTKLEVLDENLDVSHIGLDWLALFFRQIFHYDSVVKKLEESMLGLRLLRTCKKKKIEIDVSCSMQNEN